MSTLNQSHFQRLLSSPQDDHSSLTPSQATSQLPVPLRGRTLTDPTCSNNSTAKTRVSVLATRRHGCLRRVSLRPPPPFHLRVVAPSGPSSYDQHRRRGGA